VTALIGPPRHVEFVVIWIRQMNPRPSGLRGSAVNGPPGPRRCLAVVPRIGRGARDRWCGPDGAGAIKGWRVVPRAAGLAPAQRLQRWTRSTGAM